MSNDDDVVVLGQRVPRLVLEAAAANRYAFELLAQALAGGELKHPGRGLGPSPDQSTADHLCALHRHADRAVDLGPTLTIDHETGLPHAILAAARGLLAVQREDQERAELVVRAAAELDLDGVRAELATTPSGLAADQADQLLADVMQRTGER